MTDGGNADPEGRAVTAADRTDAPETTAATDQADDKAAAADDPETARASRVDEVLAHWGRERPDLDPSPIGVFGRIAIIDRLLEDRLGRFFAAHGLILGLFDVLAALRRLGFPYRAKPSELALVTMLTSGGMTGRLDQLERMGLVKRVSDPEDRRVMFAQLSPEGLELIDHLIEVHLAQEAELLSDLSADQREALADLLRTLELRLQESSNRP